MSSIGFTGRVCYLVLHNAVQRAVIHAVLGQEPHYNNPDSKVYDGTISRILRQPRRATKILLPLQREHGFGRLHRMGGLAGLTELSNQRAPIFRVRRQRPRGRLGRSQKVWNCTKNTITYLSMEGWIRPGTISFGSHLCTSLHIFALCTVFAHLWRGAIFVHLCPSLSIFVHLRPSSSDLCP